MSDNILPEFASKNIENEAALMYGGFTQTRDNSGVTTRFTVIGYRPVIDALETRYPKNSQHEKYGTLKELTKAPGEGPYWTATFVYSKERADDDSESGAGTLTGPKSSQLTVRMMSCPIETAKKYRYNWNKNFYVNYAWYTYRMRYMRTQTYWTIGSTSYHLNELIAYIYQNDGHIYKEDGVSYHRDLVEEFGLQDYIKWSDTVPR